MSASSDFVLYRSYFSWAKEAAEREAEAVRRLGYEVKVVFEDKMWNLYIRKVGGKSGEHSSGQGEEESLYDRMVRAAEECCREVREKLQRFVAGVQTSYGRGELLKLLQYTFERDIPELQVPNVDWDSTLKWGKYGTTPVPRSVGLRAVREEYEHMMRMVEEDLMLDVDRIWGLEEPGYRAEAVEPAEILAEELLKPFYREREEFFKSLGLEACIRDWRESKEAVKAALSAFDMCMKRKVPELRGYG
ncbi:MAG: hypothetical protein QXO67_02750 [Candidatus Bathyarchaeia archaeon]